ncbi:MAG: prepilin-type N-terminal cleavage/methylation domain-containing protein [Candidatus Omnitrophica bacterium]|nr:prepilin-type N-terminal cleavage/methylation domain-containing protein [Candidatus Omnitrophota bacterium]
MADLCENPGSRRVKPSRGLTLLELLVVISLLALVMMAVIGMMMGGLRVYARSQDYSQMDQHLVLAFETMRRDLHNARRFKPVAYQGAYDQLEFPALIFVELSDESRIEEMGRVGYYLDFQRKTLCRSRRPYWAARNRSLRETCDPLLTGVDRLRFEYYLPDSSGDYEWTASLDSEEPPLAVKVEIGYTEKNSRQRQARSTVIHLPAAAPPAPPAPPR